MQCQLIMNSCFFAGWWDDSTGKIIFCSSGCERGFHQHCLHPALDTLPEGPWTCSRCDGSDTEICCVCDHEWYVLEKDSGYITQAICYCVKGRVSDGITRNINAIILR